MIKDKITDSGNTKIISGFYLREKCTDYFT